MIDISFFVPGIPIPKGSARAFVNKRTGRAIVTAANTRTKPWEQAIRLAAAERVQGATREGVCVDVIFRFPRPKWHYGKRGLRNAAPRYHVTKPDGDKLLRTLLDAMTGIVFADDSQVVEISSRKQYVGEMGTEQPGALVSVFTVI